MGGESALLWGILFGSVGLGYFIYGRKERRVVPLVSGICLMVFPYMIPSPWLLVVLCVGFMALPYFVRI